ncbi:sulfatase-like hydrolase/transferase [Hyunsoonleella rubra]|uniref:Sulfatase-like hydrolase/transferase n=1 Tax=Hyunsoonleella rubra TaxID=1737062 RepID=A0ABW5T9W2_9FLAO
MKWFVFALAFIGLFSCSSNSEIDTNSEEDTMEMENQADKLPNILLVIADDMGLDATPGYNIGTEKPNMPHLQKLMDTGIRFNNLWSNPTCTPTRGTILTGKYGFRTNVLAVDDPLSTSETSLQKYLDLNTDNAYAHAVIGKWHLSRSASHPNDMGVGYYAGFTGGGMSSYSDWMLNVNGTRTASTEYTTSKFTDLAIDWVDQQSKPWFLWLAYNAPHTPFHLPPNNLHSKGALPSDETSINNNPLPYYLAMLEALDTEMGRLINSLSEEERENTIIIFIGDNGTPGQVAQQYNSRRVKGSVYQGGVNVPMIVSGKGVERINATENALINTTDLFATIADIAGTGITEVHDSRSFKTLFNSSMLNFRDYTYAETEDLTIRNNTHKYIVFDNGSEALYNLGSNPLENPNLLNPNQLPLNDTDESIKNELASKLTEIRN